MNAAPWPVTGTRVARKGKVYVVVGAPYVDAQGVERVPGALVKGDTATRYVSYLPVAELTEA